MRRVLILAVLALAVPMASWASGFDFTNQFGSISISTSGIASKGSQLISWGSFAAAPGKSLGSVSFGTGALISGSIASGGQFSDAGSYFDVTGVGTWFPGFKGKFALFTGTFLGPVNWTLISSSGQKLEFSLSGEIQGMLYTGRIVTGSTTQDIFSATHQLANGVAHVRGGTSTLNTPEPGTLGLLGTGLVGIAGLFRRKRNA